jgi:hypothetical protein
MAYFDAQKKAQADGLDAAGREPVPGDRLIAMELIQGKREELYWEQVPEKVRRQAVARAVEAHHRGAVGDGSSVSLAAGSTTRRGEAGGGWRRKRARES